MRSFIFYLLYRLNILFKPFSSNRLRVLAYHQVPNAAVFEEQIKHLISGYSIIGIDDVIEHIFQKKELPVNPLLITFDDGDSSVFEDALPLLKKYRLNSAMFIITGLINTNEDNWIKRVESKEMDEGSSYLQARQKIKYLKTITNAEREEEMKKYPPVYKRQLTIENLREMQGNGMYIGNHTHTHPMLDTCSKEEVKKELDQAKGIFEELDLKGFNIFAYPNGNLNEKTQDVLKEYGMKLVFLFDHKINKKEIDPFRISRLMVDADMEAQEFKAKVLGVKRLPQLNNPTARFFS